MTAVVGCHLGQTDDAPGLGGLSLLLALAILLHAFIAAGVLSRKSAWLAGEGVAGGVGVAAPFVLYMGGEIAFPSPFWLVLIGGIALLANFAKKLMG